MRKRRGKNNLLQGTADGHKQSRLLQNKNEQLREKAVHFCLLPPTVFMQVYQLFFAPLPTFAPGLLERTNKKKKPTENQ